jgi:phospholipid-binding lipoprotein MlaA
MKSLKVSARRTAALGCIALLLAGCATTGQRNPADPIEPFNRGVYKFNDSLDRAVLRPVARSYVRITPKWFRTGVGNFYTNLGYPWTIVNQILQGKILQAGQDTLRFALNTTLGLAGLLDPASDANLPVHDEDLGQTLGVWGVPPGPFLMLPLFGPATVRDVPSRVAETFAQPFYWYDFGNARWFSLGLSVVDTRARLLPLDGALARAFDPYAFIRDAYLQRQLYLVHDGNIPEELLPKDDLEDPGEDLPPEEPDAAPDESTRGSPQSSPPPTESSQAVPPGPG